MRFLILSGMSGAGKSTALNMLEDIGFYCVDNLPIELLVEFADKVKEKNPERGQAAVTVDKIGRASCRERV